MEIAQGTTAHQADDCKYYKRYNFESVAMRDYEVRDTMRRKSHALVRTDLSIVIGKRGVKNKVIWRVRNESDILVRWTCSVVQIPFFILGKPVRFPDEQSVFDDEAFTFWRLTPSNHHGGPLYPRGHLSADFPFTFSELRHVEGKELKSAEIVKFKTFADDAPPSEGSFSIADIIHRSEFN